MVPVLYLVIPCYNEEEVLPETSKLFLAKIMTLAEAGKISDDSRVLFVNDGSRDSTWEIIRGLCGEDVHYSGVSLSHNRGHQNALIAGLVEASKHCDAAISLDCDGQDDINAMDKMVDEYLAGCEIVYGVRSKRTTDTWFKRTTAEGFYHLMNWMGAEVVFNHADYRLVSSRVLNHLADYEEVNIFLRGMIPLVGFKSASVYYERAERMAGESHYPLKKMLALAFNGITSLSVKPVSMVTGAGFILILAGLILAVAAIVQAAIESALAGLSTVICVLCLLGGLQMIALGIVGQYVGKTYLEAKRRPRYIISERTWKSTARHWIEEKQG